MIKRELEKLTGLCYEISTTTKDDVFFNYSPHVNTFDVYIYVDGWAKGKDPIYLTNGHSWGCTIDNINEIIEKLEEIRREM